MLDWSVAGCRVMSLPGGLLVAGIDDDQAKKRRHRPFSMACRTRNSHIPEAPASTCIDVSIRALLLTPAKIFTSTSTSLKSCDPAGEQLADDGADDGHGASPEEELVEEITRLSAISDRGDTHCAKRRERRDIDKGRTDVDAQGDRERIPSANALD